MEEDIKILEDFFEDRMDIEEEKRALDNLIKGYRELEEENSKIEYVEKETIHNANPEDWNTKGRYTIRYHNRIDVIPKSKIKEKIEQLKLYLSDIPFNRMLNFTIESKIQVLQELMEDK